MKARSWIVVAAAMSYGCDSIPYQVQWGKDPAVAPGTTTDSTRAPSPVVREMSPAERATNWESLHDDLGRRLSSRKPGDPIPLDKLENCERSLRHLREVRPGHEAAFDRAAQLYALLASRGTAATPTWCDRLLREVEREVDSTATQD